MSRLSQLIQTKQVFAKATFKETNLEEGKIYLFYAGRSDGNFGPEFCWCSPGNGVAEIEIWGASGSAGTMCCCGLGIPGNPGAYSKSIVEVNSASRVRGNTGVSCGNASALCFRGCSVNTGVCITSFSGNFCMCAQGGRGGESRCGEGVSLFTCFADLGYCTTPTGVGCGLVCNFGNGIVPNAFGGNEINCQGSFSCIFIGHCNSCCWPLHTQYITTSPYLYSQEPVTVQATMDPLALTVGFSVDSLQQGLAGISTSPSSGSNYRYCWNSTQYCGCYEAQGCKVVLPTGIPAPGATPCNSVRDHGLRGGMGAVKIKFISS
jgi:hypothetical protein